MTEFKLLADYHRHDIVKLLPNTSGNLGIELGVAKGIFSDRMMSSGYFQQFFGVDMYADLHNTNQYKEALTRVGLFQPYKLLRMRFDEALDLFDDQTFDFIYVDGYAHTGEEGGETIFQWFKKLKVGGLIAGDDYDAEAWPLVVDAVNDFASKAGGELLVTGLIEEQSYCQHPTWAMMKTAHVDLQPDSEMVARGKSTTRKIHRRRKKRKALKEKLGKFFGNQKQS